MVKSARALAFFLLAIGFGAAPLAAYAQSESGPGNPPPYANPYGMPAPPMFAPREYRDSRRARPFPPARAPQPYPPARMVQPGQWRPGFPPAPPRREAERHEPPIVDAWISERNPYVQQSLLYRIRVMSDEPLHTVTPEISGSTAYIVKSLGEPLTFTATVNGRQKNVYEYRNLLMPVATGDFTIKAVRVSGAFAGPQGSAGPAFSITAPSGISLQVRPAATGADPWLPLYDLRLGVDIEKQGQATAGQPIRINVEIAALGASGTQLPSIEDQLASEDFQVYHDNVATYGDVSDQHGVLRGRRIETYVLVPRFGGILRLPRIDLQWWNVRTGREEVATIAGLMINVAGPPRPQEDSDKLAPDDPTAATYFWLPMLLAGFFVLAYWLWAWFGPKSATLPAPLARGMRTLFGTHYQRLQILLRRISPQRHIHRLRTWVGRNLPVSWKLWFCLRAVEGEEDPAEWAQALQILAAKHLGVPPNASLARLGQDIAAQHPRADRDTVADLMRELDQAVYARRDMSDFSVWKKRLKSQIQPSLAGLIFGGRDRSDRRHRPYRELPGLNPR